MLKIFSHFNHRNRKPTLSIVPGPTRKKYYFYLQPQYFEVIRVSKNWPKHGAFTRFAEALGVSRQCGRGVAKGIFPCSGWIMGRIAELQGIEAPQCWCFMFEKRGDFFPKNHPIWNMEKYEGVVPYARYSSSAHLRKDGDYVPEMEQK